MSDASCCFTWNEEGGHQDSQNAPARVYRNWMPVDPGDQPGRSGAGGPSLAFLRRVLSRALLAVVEGQCKSSLSFPVGLQGHLLHGVDVPSSYLPSPLPSTILQPQVSTRELRRPTIRMPQTRPSRSFGSGAYSARVLEVRRPTERSFRAEPSCLARCSPVLACVGLLVTDRCGSGFAVLYSASRLSGFCSGARLLVCWKYYILCGLWLVARAYRPRAGFFRPSRAQRPRSTQCPGPLVFSSSPCPVPRAPCSVLSALRALPCIWPMPDAFRLVAVASCSRSHARDASNCSSIASWLCCRVSSRGECALSHRIASASLGVLFGG